MPGTEEPRANEIHCRRCPGLSLPVPRNLSICFGISRRRSAPSFARACSTWDSTVRTESTSRWLICTFVSPSATRRQISSSRSVGDTFGMGSFSPGAMSTAGRGSMDDPAALIVNESTAAPASHARALSG